MGGGCTSGAWPAPHSGFRQENPGSYGQSPTIYSPRYQRRIRVIWRIPSWWGLSRLNTKPRWTHWTCWRREQRREILVKRENEKRTKIVEERREGRNEKESSITFRLTTKQCWL